MRRGSEMRLCVAGAKCNYASRERNATMRRGSEMRLCVAGAKCDSLFNDPQRKSIVAFAADCLDCSYFETRFGFVAVFHYFGEDAVGRCKQIDEVVVDGGEIVICHGELQ
ncbi:MAG: hypothetical protein ACI9G1_005063 [Pirellulaceae bacterium]|jgi:hypothetical protein